MAKIPLVYPKMQGSRIAPSESCIAFEKYDGTNLHWVWDLELGWHAFGTRRDRFDLDSDGITEFGAKHCGLEQAAPLFLESTAQWLAAVFQANSFFDSDKIVAFTEFLGPRSFAGKHKPEDPKRLVLFDIQTEKGFLSPTNFIKKFAKLPIARVVYRGKLTGKFVNDVREGGYDVDEGVVCKGSEAGSRWMFKIKTNSYMQRLKEAFASDWEEYWE